MGVYHLTMEGQTNQPPPICHHKLDIQSLLRGSVSGFFFCFRIGRVILFHCFFLTGAQRDAAGCDPVSYSISVTQYYYTTTLQQFFFVLDYN